MARYFFDLREGTQLLVDEHGAICADDRSAVEFAWRTLAAVVGDPTTIVPWQRADIVIRRADGCETGRIGMTVEVETPNRFDAASHPKKLAQWSPVFLRHGH